MFSSNFVIKPLVLLLLVVFSYSVCAQVGIGTTSPEATLDIRAVDHEGTVNPIDGILVPRVTDLSVSGQTDGQLIYLLADNGLFTKGFHYWDSTASTWTPINSNIEPWYRAGTTDPATSNTDNIYSLGQVGIGTTNPLGALHITTENSRDVLFFRFIDGGSDDLDLDLFRSEGTLESPSLLQDNTRIGGLRGQSIINTGTYAFSPSAEIYFQADGASSSSSSSGKIKFATTPSGATSTQDRMTIRANGNVGIGTTDPQNDLHVDGGLRLTDAPAGSDEDAATRLLAKNINNDVVAVTRDQVFGNSGLPRVVYSAKYGVGGTSFFNNCSCPANTVSYFHLDTGNVDLSNTDFINVINPSTVSGDEYFTFAQDGFYVFEIQSAFNLDAASNYFINLRVNITRADNTVINDSVRIYAGQPSTFPGQIAVPAAYKYHLFFNAGDSVRLGIFAPFASNYINSGTPTGSSYGTHISITRFD